MFNFLKKEVLGITKRIIRRDFSGNTGVAIKNSILQFSSSIVSKLGSLALNIILARMLLPETYGLYTLSLSIIVFFSSFGDMGIGSALITYLSRYKDNIKKAGAYLFFLRNLKIKLVLIVALILMMSSYFIANVLYKKPIFYSLLAGGLYIVSSHLLAFVISLFQAQNNFKYPFYKEIFFQTIRVILIPMTILFLITKGEEILIGGIFLALSLCFILSIFFIYPKIKRYPREILEKEEKKEVYKFILPLGVTSLSLVFFGNVDIMMLGKFVESSYIGFYQIAISVLSSIIAFIPFAAAFFPLFSRLPKEKLDLALKKAVFFTIAVSIIVFIFSFVFSEIAIKIIFGENYLFSSTLIKIFCVLVIIDPLNAVLSNFYISQNKSNFLAKCLIFSLILNIILNYLFISSFLKISMYYATIGASLATIISRSFYLLLLVKNRKNI